MKNEYEIIDDEGTIYSGFTLEELQEKFENIREDKELKLKGKVRLIQVVDEN